MVTYTRCRNANMHVFLGAATAFVQLLFFACRFGSLVTVAGGGEVLGPCLVAARPSWQITLVLINPPLPFKSVRLMAQQTIQRHRIEAVRLRPPVSKRCVLLKSCSRHGGIAPPSFSSASSSQSFTRAKLAKDWWPSLVNTYLLPTTLIRLHSAITFNASLDSGM